MRMLESRIGKVERPRTDLTARGESCGRCVSTIAVLLNDKWPPNMQSPPNDEGRCTKMLFIVFYCFCSVSILQALTLKIILTLATLAWAQRMLLKFQLDLEMAERWHSSKTTQNAPECLAGCVSIEAGSGIKVSCVFNPPGKIGRVPSGLARTVALGGAKQTCDQYLPSCQLDSVSIFRMKAFQKRNLQINVILDPQALGQGVLYHHQSEKIKKSCHRSGLAMLPLANPSHSWRPIVLPLSTFKRILKMMQLWARTCEHGNMMEHVNSMRPSAR